MFLAYFYSTVCFWHIWFNQMFSTQLHNCFPFLFHPYNLQRFQNYMNIDIWIHCSLERFIQFEKISKLYGNRYLDQLFTKQNLYNLQRFQNYMKIDIWINCSLKKISKLYGNRYLYPFFTRIFLTIWKDFKIIWK